MMKRSILLALLAAACVAGWPALAAAASGPTCADCHDEVAAGMTHQIHMRIQPFEVQGREVGCEGCHGDGTAHMDSGDAADIRTFAGKSAKDAEACLSCHSTKGQPEWHASTHAMEGVVCLDCHSIHKANVNPLNACGGCHQDTMAQFTLPSHHPLREGAMSCVSCHDPHASTEAQLKTNHMRTNDLCYTCHQAQEGPFIFEHEPVGEDCRICHQPHGSVANNLLTANEPMLCLQCHEIHFHAGLKSPLEEEIEVGGIHRTNPNGLYGMNQSFTTKCSTCHHSIHGSDLPSNTLASGGHGLTR